MELVQVAEALKDPVLIVAATWAALELRALRRAVAWQRTALDGLEEDVDEHETRLAVLEDRVRKPTA